MCVVGCCLCHAKLSLSSRLRAGEMLHFSSKVTQFLPLKCPFQQKRLLWLPRALLPLDAVKLKTCFKLQAPCRVSTVKAK